MTQLSVRRVLGVLIGLALLIGPPGVITPLWGDAAQDLKKAEQKRNETLQQRKKAEADRLKMLSQERSVLSVLDRLERDIEGARRTIGELHSDIASLRQNIHVLEQGIADLQATRVARRELLAARLRANYKINYITPSGMFAMAFRADDLQALLVRLEYVARIRARDNDIIEQYAEDERALAARKDEVELQQATLVERQSSLRTQEASLASQRQERQSTLTAVRRDIHLKERAIRDYDTALVQMKALIARLERDLGGSGDVAAPRQAPGRRYDSFRTNGSAIGATGGRTVTVSGIGSIRWPVEGQIIENVSPALEGVTIRCQEEGQPVHAVRGGKVEYADWFNGLGFGQLVVLNHGNGLRSFYAHLRDIGAAQGEVVEQGQTIGTVGSTGSLIGPALYFEIRRHFDVIHLDLSGK